MAKLLLLCLSLCQTSKETGEVCWKKFFKRGPGSEGTCRADVNVVQEVDGSHKRFVVLAQVQCNRCCATWMDSNGGSRRVDADHQWPPSTSEVAASTHQKNSLVQSKPQALGPRWWRRSGQRRPRFWSRFIHNRKLQRLQHVWVASKQFMHCWAKTTPMRGCWKLRANKRECTYVRDLLESVSICVFNVSPVRSNNWREQRHECEKAGKFSGGESGQWVARLRAEAPEHPRLSRAKDSTQRHSPVTPASAHAYQVVCLTRHVPTAPCLNFRFSKTVARYPHLPNVRATTRERGKDHCGWAIYADGGNRVVDGETLAGWGVIARSHHGRKDIMFGPVITSETHIAFSGARSSLQ